MPQRYQRILHVDGDAYFASCEIALDPKLKGRPVLADSPDDVSRNRNGRYAPPYSR
jgi:nucleotidyltransferase/DNA polymerase involved in DNA repair